MSCQLLSSFSRTQTVEILRNSWTVRASRQIREYRPKCAADLKQGLELPNPPFRIHRLDKTTTGCFVLARSKDVSRELSTQLRARTVDKTYLALVRGGSQSFSQKTGQIRTPLRYLDGRATIVTEAELQALDPEGPQPKESKTDWEVVASSVSYVGL